MNQVHIFFLSFFCYVDSLKFCPVFPVDKVQTISQKPMNSDFIAVSFSFVCLHCKSGIILSGLSKVIVTVIFL